MSWLLVVVIILINVAFLIATYILLHPGITKRLKEKIDNVIDEAEDRKNN